MKQVCLRLILVTMGFLAFFSVQGLAQEATILGTVTDPSGAAVPKAVITITNLDTGKIRHVESGQSGDFVAPALHIGHYVVSSQATGFKAFEKKDIVLEVGDRTRVDIKLELGTSLQTVTVEAQAVTVQTDTGEVSGLIKGKQVTDLAVNGRSFYNLVALLPGTSSTQPDFQIPTPVGGSAGVTVNGNRSVHNIYLLDGGEDLDRGGAGSMSVMPSQDAIAEFRVLASNYGADYGLSSAATTTMVLKSGTNQFHASAWEFDRNDALQGVNAFRRSKPELRFNVFGFNVGGPVTIHKSSTEHKTFFFYNMEWRKLIQGGNLNTNVPDPSVYGGAFPASMTAAQLHTPCSNQASAAIATAFTNAGQTLSTAGTGGACTAAAGATLVPFTNNTIPAGLLDANAQLLLNTAKIFPTTSLVPVSGKPWFDQFRGGANSPTNVKEEIARVDHSFSDKFSVFGHWISEQISQGFGTTIWSGDNVPSIGTTFGNPSYSGVVHATYTISPTLLNETAFNYNGNRINILPVGTYQAPSGFTFNRVFTGPNVSNRIPSIGLNGGTGTNYDINWMPWKNRADDYQVRDDISWVKGSHQFKFGGSWALYKKVQDLFAPTQGSYGFNGFFTGNDIADFLLGYANSYSENAVQDTGYWNNVSWAAYLQDNWRKSSRLTLNLGLRWDGAPHTYEANNRMGNFYPSMWNPANAATFLANGTIDPAGPAAGALGTSPNSILSGYQFYLNGVGIEGKPGVPKGLVNNHWLDFGPRVGFAYDLTGAGKTFIRGGFGMMYERIQGNDMYNAGPNVPFSANVGLNKVSLSNPRLNVTTGVTSVYPPLPIVVNSMTGLAINDYREPTSYQYSFSLERQLGAKAVLSVAYVGSQDRHQNYYQQINNPPQSALASLIANGGSTYNSLVPYLGFRTLNMSSNTQNAHYNSLQVSLNGELRHNLTTQIAYTYSKAFDEATGGSAGDLTTSSNPYDRNYDYGPSSFDRRHVFVANFIYDIPFFRSSSNRAERIGLGGWELSGIITAETGHPLNLTLGGTAGSNGLPSATNRPDLKGSISYTKNLNAWFDTSAFATPTPGNWGNLPHNSVYGPGRDNWNLSLFKSFTLSEARGSRLELRFESFNTWNHVQWNGVDSGFSSGTFGHVTSAFDPRTFQLGAKLYF